jgi:hypothetical protein
MKENKPSDPIAIAKNIARNMSDAREERGFFLAHIIHLQAHIDRLQEELKEMKAKT